MPHVESPTTVHDNSKTKNSRDSSEIQLLQNKLVTIQPMLHLNAVPMDSKTVPTLPVNAPLQKTKVMGIQRRMFDDYLSYFTDVQKTEKMKEALKASKGGEKLFEDLSKLFVQDMEVYNPIDAPKGPQNKYVPLQEKKFFILWDSLYLNQPELVKKGLDVDLYYKQKQKASKEKYISHVENKLKQKIDQIETYDRKKKQELLKQGIMFKEDFEGAYNPKTLDESLNGAANGDDANGTQLTI